MPPQNCKYKHMFLIRKRLFFWKEVFWILYRSVHQIKHQILNLWILILFPKTCCLFWSAQDVFSFDKYLLENGQRNTNITFCIIKRANSKVKVKNLKLVDIALIVWSDEQNNSLLKPSFLKCV